MYCFIKDRLTVKISGKDRIKFLQGLLTNDINKLSAANPIIYAYFLTPQGKFYADFFIFMENNEVYIDLSKPRSEEIIRKLNMYKLRSDVKIEEIELEVLSIIGNDFQINDSIAMIFQDPRSIKLGYRIYAKKNNIPSIIDNHTESPFIYEETRITNLIPDGEKDLIPDKSFPMEYGIDNFNAVDFNKGCYLGQELVSRTHYRGIVRKKLFLVACNTELPPLGTEIFAGQTKLGILCSSINNKAIALLKIEEVEKIQANSRIEANGIELKIMEQ